MESLKREKAPRRPHDHRQHHHGGSGDEAHPDPTSAHGLCCLGFFVFARPSVLAMTCRIAGRKAPHGESSDSSRSRGPGWHEHYDAMPHTNS